MKICQETPDLVKIGQKYRELYLNTYLLLVPAALIVIKALSSSEMVSDC
jgi:hypothetical protein